MPTALWEMLRSRELDPESLSRAEEKRKLMAAHWGGFAWEQVARLQHMRATLEAQAAGERLYFVQAIDKPTGGQNLTAEHTAMALKVLNMTKTGYLMGMCPLFVGMKARISRILPEPLLTRELPVVVRRLDRSCLRGAELSAFGCFGGG